MGERTSEIEEHIRRERAELASDLAQLEQKARSTLDWRNQFQSRPLMMLGVALGGGLLLGMMGGRRYVMDEGPSIRARARARMKEVRSGIKRGKQKSSYWRLGTLIGSSACLLGPFFRPRGRSGIGGIA